MEGFELRGVVEGFYGRPWTMQERAGLFDFMSDHGFNAYIYAPKNDPLHRERWREPYSEEALEAFQGLIDHARRNQIDFVFAISPGLSLRYADDSELEMLWNKLDIFAQLGVRSFGLFLDDIPPELVDAEDRRRFATLADAQAHLIGRLYERMQAHTPPLRLMVCPTVYCGSPDHPYLAELGASVALDIDILWTGPAVCSHEITQAHLGSVKQVLGRSPLLWDNYPVNDGFMVSELHLGPYRGRDARLPEVCRGIFANGMSQVFASRLPLATIGRYLRDPGGYEPEAAWDAAARELVDAGLREPLRVFAASNTISCLEPGDPPALRQIFVQVGQALWSFQIEQGIAALARTVEVMKDAHARLSETGPQQLIEEIRPWLDDYRRWTVELDSAVRIYVDLSRLFMGAEPDVLRTVGQSVLERRQAIRQALKELVDVRTFVCGEAVRNFLQETLRRTAIIEMMAGQSA